MNDQLSESGRGKRADYLPEWRDATASLMVAFILGGVVAALLADRAAPGLEGLIVDLYRLYILGCCALAGYFGMLKPAMRRQPLEGGGQFLYPLKARAIAWVTTCFAVGGSVFMTLRVILHLS